MSAEIKELHDKIGLLDSKFDDLHTQQALVNQSVSQMATALDKLVDLRAETLLIMQQCEINTREHDELFGRVRALEDAKAACPVLHKGLDDEIKTLKEDRIAPMEDNQKWVVRSAIGAIGAIILAILTLVITHA